LYLKTVLLGLHIVEQKICRKLFIIANYTKVLGLRDLRVEVRVRVGVRTWSSNIRLSYHSM
jgi:hypothetical protein